MVKTYVLSKTWNKFRKLGKSFQKTYGHPASTTKHYVPDQSSTIQVVTQSEVKFTVYKLKFI